MLPSRGAFEPVNVGWGLVDAITGLTVDPAAMVSDSLIEISDWELQDFAIQVVRTRLEKDGGKPVTWQSSPDIDPSIWFDDGTDPCWAIVRAVRYPKLQADRPPNLEDIKAFCANRSNRGFFASVSAANAHDSFDPTGSNAMRLYRGHGLAVRFQGLEPLDAA